MPHKFKIELHRALKELRVSGFERKESNEWFYGDEELVIEWIKYIAIRDNLSIFRNSWGTYKNNMIKARAIWPFLCSS